LIERRRTKHPLLADKIVHYVLERQNEDGGYTFCQGAESNRQDTYYGLAILNLLNASFPNVKETIKFLREPYQSLGNIYWNYFTTKALLLCGEEPYQNLRQHLALEDKQKKQLGAADILPEVSSEFTTILMTLELSNLLGVEPPQNRLMKWLLSFKNEDGGFGLNNNSNINSTYYAIASLTLLKAEPNVLTYTVGFVRECEKPFGGFTLIPMNFTPYVEQTYFGVLTLDLIGEHCRYPAQTIDFLLRCQNKNGGFSRSDMGISTFLNTFQAVTLLRKLDFL
jgi:hypothetical protein